MNILVSLGKRIQVVRERLGLTQEQLEEKTGVNTKYISAIERGQKNTTIKTLEKIAKGLNIELYELLLPVMEVGSDKAVKKAIESLMKEADSKSLKLCLDFLRRAAG
jgi:transcriptional regulator with XRE-family HTH domain